MKLGAFSMSLAVKDIKRSRQFYEKLGFVQAGGVPGANWLIMRNGDSVIGLFQDMFTDNILTFNPGWNQQGEELPAFDDVRNIQRALLDQGVKPVQATDPGTSGPASLMVKDPDGNLILIDQHR